MQAFPLGSAPKAASPSPARKAEPTLSSSIILPGEPGGLGGWRRSPPTQMVPPSTFHPRIPRKSLKLWASGNYDARILVTMIVEPEKLKSSEIDAWAKDISGYPITDAFSGVVKKTPFIMKKMEQWTNRKGKWHQTAGWNLVTNLAQDDETLDDAFFEQRLKRIEAEIHNAPNRTRYAMNMTLICIGCRNQNLEKKALAAAKRIGKVEVDHGETGCKTPDAADYIKKTLAYRAKKKKGK